MPLVYRRVLRESCRLRRQESPSAVLPVIITPRQIFGISPLAQEFGSLQMSAQRGREAQQMCLCVRCVPLVVPPSKERFFDAKKSTKTDRRLTEEVSEGTHNLAIANNVHYTA